MARQTIAELEGELASTRLKHNRTVEDLMRNLKYADEALASANREAKAAREESARWQAAYEGSRGDSLKVARLEGMIEAFRQTGNIPGPEKVTHREILDRFREHDGRGPG